MPRRFRMKENVGTHFLRRPDGTLERIVPGATVTVESEDDLRPALDKFVALDPAPPDPEATIGLRLVSRSAGWWDVINEATGKPINDRALQFEEAAAITNRGGEPEPEEEQPEPETEQPERDEPTPEEIDDAGGRGR